MKLIFLIEISPINALPAAKKYPLGDTFFIRDATR
jgi:hypothetical protein